MFTHFSITICLKVVLDGTRNHLHLERFRATSSEYTQILQCDIGPKERWPGSAGSLPTPPYTTDTHTPWLLHYHYHMAKRGSVEGSGICVHPFYHYIGGRRLKKKCIEIQLWLGCGGHPIKKFHSSWPGHALVSAPTDRIISTALNPQHNALVQILNCSIPGWKAAKNPQSYFAAFCKSFWLLQHVPTG